MAIVLYDLCAGDSERRFSPHCWKARMALAHKGLAFETRPTPFTKISEIGGGFSPTVPVIDDGGKLVRDSFDIALYLEEAYPDRPSLFAGEGGKAMSRFVESWAMTSVHPPLMGLIVKDIHDRLGDADQIYFRESREKRLRADAGGGAGGPGEPARRVPGRLAAATDHARQATVHRRRNAVVRRLHRVRPVAMGAGDQSVPSAGRR